MSELILVVTHLPDREHAQRAARRMIRSHLASSAQIASTEKIYYWHGQWHEEQKWVLALMSIKSRYRALEAALRALHAEGEEPPPIFGIPCTSSLPTYADWVRDKVLASENAQGVRPAQAVNFLEAESSLPPALE